MGSFAKFEELCKHWVGFIDALPKACRSTVSETSSGKLDPGPSERVHAETTRSAEPASHSVGTCGL